MENTAQERKLRRSAKNSDTGEEKLRKLGGGRMEISEIIFKVFAYVFATIFAIFCLYPFIYAISAALSGIDAYNNGEVILWPVDIQIDAFKAVVNTKLFWLTYSNTLFVTLYGTIWCMVIGILGGYALSKRRMCGHRVFNFLLVFTMWFAAGMVPMFLNYQQTQTILGKIGITDDKWLVVIAMGMAAYNIILLRNAFDGVPSEIEEAAKVDGANEFQIMSRVYVPMSKATIATVTLFFAISRWNGYFWARQMIRNPNQFPLQVFIREQLELYAQGDNVVTWNFNYAPNSLIYAMIVCAIIPIIIIYPYIQKYFASGVNLGGVKE